MVVVLSFSAQIEVVNLPLMNLMPYVKKMVYEGSCWFHAPPQQNRVVERNNRTVIEMARSMMTSCLFPKQLWNEVVAMQCISQIHHQQRKS